jgi:hypothetical protein
MKNVTVYKFIFKYSLVSYVGFEFSGAFYSLDLCTILYEMLMYCALVQDKYYYINKWLGFMLLIMISIIILNLLEEFVFNILKNNDYLDFIYLTVELIINIFFFLKIGRLIYVPHFRHNFILFFCKIKGSRAQ